jgi:ribosomal protein L11 methyltransferase
MHEAAMTTFTALTTLAGKARAEALAEAMEALEPAPSGVGVFEIEDGSGRWEVGGYFEARPDPAALALLSAAFGAQEFAVSQLPEVDWVAKVRRELVPVEAGRFFVYGSHDADRVPEGRVALLIEAAMAFGTGHHGTTLGCLRALDRIVAAGMVKQRVADIGCGTAVLAMAAAHVWPNPVLASDIDTVAVEVAQANVAANRLQGRVECIEATGFDHPAIAAAAPFDLVLANILMGPLVDLAPAMAAHVAPGGHVILSGLLTGQAEAVIAAYAAAGFDLAEREDIGDWATLVMQRRG